MPIESPAIPALSPEIASRRLLSMNEVSTFMKINRHTIRRMMNRKDNPMPSLKIGGNRRFRLDKLLKWIDRHEE